MPATRWRLHITLYAVALSLLVAIPGFAGTRAPHGGNERLTGDVLPLMFRHHDLGPTSPTQQLHLTFTVARPHEADEVRAFEQLYRAPAVHRAYLSPASFDRLYGVSSSRRHALIQWLRAGGLNVLYAARDGSVVLTSGTVAKVDRLLHVHLHSYAVGNKQVFGNAAPPEVPAYLELSGILGLTNAFAAHVPGTDMRSSHTAQGDCFPVLACTGGTSPQDLWSIYDMPGTATGRGQGVAILGAGSLDPVLKHLQSFESLRKLPSPRTRIISVGDDFRDTTQEAEWDLDSQAAVGMAPSISELAFYFGKSLGNEDAAAVVSRWVNDPFGPAQANASWGECEANPVLGTVGRSAPLMYEDSVNRSLRQAALEGRTLFAATGDSGGSCWYGVGLNGFVNGGVPLLNFPAASPYAVAVGGTVLSSSGGKKPTRTWELAWNYSGGGASAFIAQPTYQKHVATVTGISSEPPPCAAQPDGTPYAGAQACRVIPDISAQAGMLINNGYSVVNAEGTDVVAWGTSLSSPLCAGMWARVQSALATKRKPTIGFANPLLYKVGSKSSAAARSAFFDVGGTTKSLPSSNGQMQTAARSNLDPTGYDPVSGLGVIDVRRLITQLHRISRAR